MTTLLLVVHAILAAIAVVVSLLGVTGRTPARTRKMAAWLLGAVIAQTVVGDVLYPIYLLHTKPAFRALTTGSRSVADIFDVKEHFAYFALVLTIGLFALTRREPKPTPFVRVLFGCAHGAVLLAATLGLVVASLGTP